MATHSSVLAWRIPGTAEPGGLPSMGSHRVGHDWSDLVAAAAAAALSGGGFPDGSVLRIHLPSRRHGFDPWLEKTPWRRKWQPTPVFLPGKSHGQRRLVGYSPWGHERFKCDLETKQQQQMKWREKLFFISQCRAKIFFVFAQYRKVSQKVFINQILTKEAFWVKITNVLTFTYCFRT